MTAPALADPSSPAPSSVPPPDAPPSGESEAATEAAAETAVAIDSPVRGFAEDLRATAEEFLAISWQTWVLLGAAILVGLLVHAALFAVLRRMARRNDNRMDDRFVRRLRGPALLVFPLLALQFVLPSTPELADIALLRHLMSLATITAVVLIAMALVRATADLIKRRHDVTVADNYAARRLHTQVDVLSRVLVVVVTIIGIAVALMTFPRVSELGTSLLASAGIVGIVVGFAARPVLENLIAGIQLALTQPINLDDVVVVDGEWGRIEEITTTYVVVRIWDERRLICPFSTFISGAFQNWTRRTAQILGTVFIHADYCVPFDAVRQELERVVRGSDSWDGRVCVLQVTEATAESVELRALVSAASGPAAWDLRVHVREKLIEFLQREHPGSLPRRRVRLEGDVGDELAGEPARPVAGDEVRPA